MTREVVLAQRLRGATTPSAVDGNVLAVASVADGSRLSIETVGSGNLGHGTVAGSRVDRDVRIGMMPSHRPAVINAATFDAYHG